jgi:hypothetical protein
VPGTSSDVGSQRPARRLNHVEFVYRPGERHLVEQFFELLAIDLRVMREGRALVGVIDPDSFRSTDNENYLAGSEIDPRQWAFDCALGEALRRAPLAASFNEFQTMLLEAPQRGMHFGINFVTPDAWQQAVERVTHVDALAPPLKERVRMLQVFRPTDATPFSPLHQAFLWTDVIASGSLALGQRIELAYCGADAVDLT